MKCEVCNTRLDVVSMGTGEFCRSCISYLNISGLDPNIRNIKDLEIDDVASDSDKRSGLSRQCGLNNTIRPNGTIYQMNPKFREFLGMMGEHNFCWCYGLDHKIIRIAGIADPGWDFIFYNRKIDTQCPSEDNYHLLVRPQHMKADFLWMSTFNFDTKTSRYVGFFPVKDIEPGKKSGIVESWQEIHRISQVYLIHWSKLKEYCLENT